MCPADTVVGKNLSYGSFSFLGVKVSIACPFFSISVSQSLIACPRSQLKSRKMNAFV